MKVTREGAVVVCSAKRAAKWLNSQSRGSSVVALLSIIDSAPRYGGLARRPYGHRVVTNSLRLSFDDIEGNDDVERGYVGPTIEHAAAIVSFVREHEPLFALDPSVPHERHLLIHCRMGQSRSTAAAVIGYASALGPGREADAVRWALAAAEEADVCFDPNRRLIKHADTLLSRSGKLISAVS